MAATQPTQAWLSANHLITTGLTIASTATPALNATYAIEGPFITQALAAEASALALSGTTPAFADGTQEVIWPDASGAPHTFNEAQFRSFLGAVNNFIVQCMQYGLGVITTAPTGSATIP